jgi:hypothetical protein
MISNNIHIIGCNTASTAAGFIGKFDKAKCKFRYRVLQIDLMSLE